MDADSMTLYRPLTVLPEENAYEVLRKGFEGPAQNSWVKRIDRQGAKRDPLKVVLLPFANSLLSGTQPIFELLLRCTRCKALSVPDPRLEDWEEEEGPLKSVNSQLLTISRVMYFRIRCLAALGQYSQAIDELHQLTRLADLTIWSDMGAFSLLAGHVFASKISGITIAMVRDNTLSEEVLLQIVGSLAVPQYPPPHALWSYSCEYERFFTYHIQNMPVKALAAWEGTDIFGRKRDTLYWPDSEEILDRAETIQHGADVLALRTKVAALPYAERLLELRTFNDWLERGIPERAGSVSEFQKRIQGLQNPLGRCLARDPCESHVQFMPEIAAGHRIVALLYVASAAYWLRTKKIASSAEDLVRAGVLNELPLDPLTRQPVTLHYKAPRGYETL
jgi:hypothetical protein